MDVATQATMMLLFFAGGAGGMANGPKPVTDNHALKSVKIAQEFWWAKGCKPRIGEVETLISGTGDGLFAIARLKACVTPDPRASYDIILATRPYQRYSYRVRRVLRCSTIVHEMGHLLGLQHNPNPRSIMYHQPNLTQNIPKACVQAFFPRSVRHHWTGWYGRGWATP